MNRGLIPARPKVCLNCGGSLFDLDDDGVWPADWYCVLCTRTHRSDGNGNYYIADAQVTHERPKRKTRRKFELNGYVPEEDEEFSEILGD